LNSIGILRKVGIPTWISREILNENQNQIEPQVEVRDGNDVYSFDDGVELREMRLKKKKKKKRRKRTRKNDACGENGNGHCGPLLTFESARL
jgi:hypothetical protein